MKRECMLIEKGCFTAIPRIPCVASSMCLSISMVTAVHDPVVSKYGNNAVF
jgi:hypothetical protein